MPKNTSTPNPKGATELPKALGYELKEIQEMHERMNFSISQMIRTAGAMTLGELHEYCRIAEIVNHRAAVLRNQLESIDRIRLNEICKKLWDVEWSAKRLSGIYWTHATLFSGWMEELRKQSSQEASHLQSLLHDPIFEPLRVNGVGVVYQNDPDISPYTPDNFRQMADRSCLQTDAVELPRAPQMPSPYATCPAPLLGDGLVTYHRQPTASKLRNPPQTPTINPALLQLRGPTSIMN
ncbi:uncharacterized protein N7458_004650 [Penicillium daleae]|uniref:Uncharacterized protein n=1 Tax=Penicillium daleae TaxID=63821 RepID=A0AAD6C8S6_9EURO|nr:uncharacterized protein N7458_004650 [Penicillium daleae]KAJ5453694.1 hypothetical protein N7458_004650 [Penicillium daleae]